MPKALKSMSRRATFSTTLDGRGALGRPTTTNNNNNNNNRNRNKLKPVDRQALRSNRRNPYGTASDPGSIGRELVMGSLIGGGVAAAAAAGLYLAFPSSSSSSSASAKNGGDSENSRLGHLESVSEAKTPPDEKAKAPIEAVVPTAVPAKAAEKAVEEAEAKTTLAETKKATDDDDDDDDDASGGGAAAAAGDFIDESVWKHVSDNIHNKKKKYYASIINESFTNLDFRFKAILKSTSKDCKKKLFEQIVQKNLIKSKDNKDASVIMVTDYLKKYFQI